MNQELIDRRAAIVAEREMLVKEKSELSAQLAGLNLTGNRVRFAWGTIDRDQLALRNTWAKRVAKIEQLILVNKQALKELEGDNDIFKDICKEVLGVEIWNQISEESKRRREGLPPVKIMIGLDQMKGVMEKNGRLRKNIKDLAGTLLQARKELTETIREGCHRYGNAEFLKLVSGVNTTIPPVVAIEKKIRESEI